MERHNNKYTHVAGIEFEKYISGRDIKKQIKILAQALNIRFEKLDPVFLCVLNGSFMFASDLLKRITIHSTISFIKVKSYSGEESTGQVSRLIGLSEELTGKHIIILEDIIDSGLTIKNILHSLESYNPASVIVISLLFKPASLKFPVEPDYYLFETGDEFVVGYGLDYDGYGRNLKDIYKKIV